MFNITMNVYLIQNPCFMISVLFTLIEMVINCTYLSTSCSSSAMIDAILVCVRQVLVKCKMLIEHEYISGFWPEEEKNRIYVLKKVVMFKIPFQREKRIFNQKIKTKNALPKALLNFKVVQNRGGFSKKEKVQQNGKGGRDNR